MHKLQKIILKRLFTQNSQRYGTLASGYDFEDNIVFHLNQLIAKGFVEKSDGIYSITLKGVKAIAKYLPDGQIGEPLELEDKGVKTFFIGFLCSDSNGNYLLKSHPQSKVNFYNLPSSKPFFGEKIENTLTRAFKMNTGLVLNHKNFKFLSLHLKTIQTSSGEILFDDAFTVYKVEVDGKQKSKMKLLDSLEWISKKDAKKIQHKWPEIDILVLGKDLSTYKSYIHISDYIL